MDRKLNLNFGLDPENNQIRERIRSIEGLNIGARQKAEAILVVLKAKPATTVSVYEGNDPPEKVRETLEGGAKLCIEEVKGIQNNNVLAEYAVARDHETAKRLSELNPDKDHEEYGQLMGIPETAIRTFGTDKTKDKSRYLDLKGIPFRFSLSKDHWREELEKLKKWTLLIKEYSPKTYSELVQEGLITRVFKFVLGL